MEKAQLAQLSFFRDAAPYKDLRHQLKLKKAQLVRFSFFVAALNEDLGHQLKLKKAQLVRFSSFVAAPYEDLGHPHVRTVPPLCC